MKIIKAKNISSFKILTFDYRAANPYEFTALYELPIKPICLAECTETPVLRRDESDSGSEKNFTPWDRL